MSTKETDLLKAVMEGNLEKVRKLISEGANANSVDKYGYSPLLWASTKEANIPIIEILLESGADVNKANISGETPLIRAADRGNEKIINLLIEHKANVNAVDMDEETPLIKAVKDGHSNIVNLLLSKGADLKNVNKHGQTALEIAEFEAESEHEEPEKQEEYDKIVKTLQKWPTTGAIVAMSEAIDPMTYNYISSDSSNLPDLREYMGDKGGKRRRTKKSKTRRSNKRRRTLKRKRTNKRK